MKKNLYRGVLTSAVLALGAVFMLAVAGIPRGQAQEEWQEWSGFPESHKDLLGASSYRWLFGLNPDFVEPGPHSSDTGTGRPPRVGPNRQVNDPQVPFPGGLLGRSETTIAASGNGNRMVVGWNDAEGFCGPPFAAFPFCALPTPPVGLSGFGFSADGGKSFTDGGAPTVAPDPLAPLPFFPLVTRGDPSLDVGGIGNDTFYYANLAVYDTGVGPFPAGVTVHTGTFQNKTFAWGNPVLLETGSLFDFLDKEHIAADKNGSRPHVYVSVTNFLPFPLGDGQIEAYSSTDGGQTFSRSIIQPDETAVPAVNQGSQPAVAPDGTVYVAWLRGFLSPTFGQGAAGVFPQIRVVSSTDFGATWTPSVLVADICSGDLFPPAGYNRPSSNSFPRTAVAQSGPDRGRVYVTWQDCRIANLGTQADTGGFGNPDTDIYVSFSDDGGSTWSAPELVAGGGDGLIQFWPTISVQPGGNVDVTYYESEEGFGTSLVDTFWAQSIDGGATWETPVIVTEVTTDWGATATNIVPNFGDYNTAVSAGNRLFATWADGRNGVPDTFFSKILTIGKAPR